MRLWGWILLTCATSGCAWYEPPRPQWVSHASNATGAALEAHMVQIDAHLIERPLGDPFIHQEIWAQADQMLLPLARRELLQVNGLRVGQLVGLPSAKLQQLLQSPRWCLDPRRRIIPSGDSITQVLSPPLADCTFEVRADRKAETLTLPQGRFFVEIQGTLEPERRTRLKFTPKIETGETMYLPYKPSVEEGAWKLSMEKPCRRLAELAFEISVLPEELIILGPDGTDEKSLGHRMFVEEDKQVERLLILRIARSTKVDIGTPTLEDLARTASPASLALQAPVPAFRGRDR